ncbi:MAG: hypothetical protein SA378_03410 [Sedimentibacter sp.]|uniref:hypothetical protein n=1 Tax=Sedimentibacter sp. TaxID=1960295 RepID=UPI002982766C|nr:hypothetical protein [Sedimentibacter sp.]MDW5299172.1 hypothetical protein [Sedimentibacter sp.]
MEQNKNNRSNFMPLFMNSIKGKKSWFFLSTVIIFVTTLLIPYILKADEGFFIMFGIAETFVIVFLNCLTDNSFLHNDSKLAYYKSKPVSFREQITINIVSNIVFTGFLLVLIALPVVFQGLDYEILESFKIIIPWLAAGIFLASLSSILTGNTLMAGVMTIFNFCLPLIIYLIILFVFTILENIVVGFSANVLMDYFVNTVYKLEYIYFVEYSEKSIDFIYLLLLGVILIGITLLIYNCLKKRKNENTGNFIVFDGYKYFVSVLVSLIIPAAFSVMSYDNTIGSKITVSVLMAILSYYIIIAIMEKSFRIYKLSIKVFAASMAVFVAATGGTVAFASRYESSVPDVEDVRMAYVGNDRWIFDYINELSDEELNSSDDFLKWQKNRNITVFTEKENIANITELHKELISNQNYNFEYYYMNDLVIAYLMNDGSVIIRDYKLKKIEGDESFDKNKDEIAYKIINSDEMKKRKYYYLYNEENYNANNLYCYVISSRSGSTVIDNVNIDEIRKYLIKDIDEKYAEMENAFCSLTFYDYDMVQTKEAETESYYLQMIDRRINDDDDDETVKNSNIDGLNLYEFENTLKYLKLN